MSVLANLTTVRLGSTIISWNAFSAALRRPASTVDHLVMPPKPFNLSSSLGVSQ